jgi:tRNA pseudouridine38-40 synthase
MRYKLTIEYQGEPFSGWQRQQDQPSVQAAIETAITRFCGETVTLYAAGRTDAGVHACGQVAHVDLAHAVPGDRLRDAVNAHLRPAPIAILAAEQVPATFHARFDATRRAYRYRIVNRRAPLTLDRGLAWQVARPLDAAKMHLAAQALVGQHDFTTFRAAGCQARSPLKTLSEISVTRHGEEIEIAVAARSFLHHQVRSITGSLKLVGEGKWPVSAIAEILAAQDRSCCGPVAPAAGLYLMQVDYPDG